MECELNCLQHFTACKSVLNSAANVSFVYLTVMHNVHLITQCLAVTSSASVVRAADLGWLWTHYNIVILT